MNSWIQRLAPFVVVMMTAVPLSAAASPASPNDRDQRRAPLWESDWASLEDGDILWYQTPDALLDPSTGDVVMMASLEEGTRLRRVDGETGLPRYEVPVDFSADVPPSAPGSSQQFTYIYSRDGTVRATAVGSDGVPLWRRELPQRGKVRATHTDPTTGETCAVIDVRRSHSVRGVLTCLDPSGQALFDQTFDRGRKSRGNSPMDVLVTADPARSRWYVADLQRKDRRETTRIRAFDAQGRRLWTRAQASIPKVRWPGVELVELTVDPAQGQVVLGYSDSRAAGISIWDHRGRSVNAKRWSAKDPELADVVVSADGRRTFVAYVDQAKEKIFVAALRGDGKQLWKRLHLRDPGASFGASLVLADDIEHVLVLGPDVAAYNWSGKRQWRGKTDPDFLWSEGLYDSARGRFLVPWTDEAYPHAGVSAFGS